MNSLRLVPLLLTLLLAAGLAPTAMAASGPGAMGDGGMMGNMGMMGGIMMFVPALIGLLLIVTLVMVIMALAKYLRQG